MGTTIDLGTSVSAREMAAGAADVLADLLAASKDVGADLNDRLLTQIIDIALLHLATGPGRPLAH